MHDMTPIKFIDNLKLYTVTNIYSVRRITFWIFFLTVDIDFKMLPCSVNKIFRFMVFIEAGPRSFCRKKNESKFCNHNSTKNHVKQLHLPVK